MSRIAMNPHDWSVVRMLLTLGLLLVIVGCGGRRRPEIGRGRPLPPAEPSRPETPADPVPTPEAKAKAESAQATDPNLNRLLALHNRQRAEAGRPPLELSPELTQAAQRHARAMAASGRFRHRGPDGSTVADRVKHYGYRFRKVGENIALGQSSAEQAIRDWMNSRGHRKNILGPFSEMGAARQTDARGRTYWCVVFGDRLPTARSSPEVRPASGQSVRP